MTTKPKTFVVDWKSAVRRNVLFSRILILIFFLMCTSIGFLIDIIFNKFYYHLAWTQSILSLITFKTFAYVAGGGFLFAFFHLGVFLIFHKKFMLMGLNPIAIKSVSYVEGAQHPLEKVLKQMAQAMGLTYVPRLYIANTPIVNAFSSGFTNKNAVVVLSKGLIELLTPREMQAILVMQLCHIKLYDHCLTSILAFVSNLNIVIFDACFHSFIYGPNRDREPNPIANMVLKCFKITRFFLPFMTFLLRFVLKPDRVYKAQKMTVTMMSDNAALAKAIIKIYEYHFDNMEQAGTDYSEVCCDEIRREAYVFDPADINNCQTFATPFTTHPPFQDQLEALKYDYIRTPITKNNEAT